MEQGEGEGGGEVAWVCVYMLCVYIGGEHANQKGNTNDFSS